VVRVPAYRSRGTGFDSLRYQIFLEVVGLERGPLSLMSTIEELLLRNSSCSGLESREYGCRDLSHWPRGTLYPQKLALTLSTSGSRSVGIVRLWTESMEFVFFLFVFMILEICDAVFCCKVIWIYLLLFCCCCIFLLISSLTWIIKNMFDTFVNSDSFLYS
jgi:hypothetical protein